MKQLLKKLCILIRKELKTCTEKNQELKAVLLLFILIIDTSIQIVLMHKNKSISISINQEINILKEKEKASRNAFSKIPEIIKAYDTMRQLESLETRLQQIKNKKQLNHEDTIFLKEIRRRLFPEHSLQFLPASKDLPSRDHRHNGSHGLSDVHSNEK